ncbi:MAG TPA: ATP-dependent sacrificial sulfur transferase LarE [Methanoregulaceae archaeon]|nr:ATP-dependent sacrificial sulfur transferase LarE [Methanoregulaceae archaeon]HPD74630.1 ATP-dependent sacrificial sulfur transferase LarE [Methanoregulaceae archaeon]HRY74900.1 ATP-dependent sacrificial sulfur transferase LarE [Methanoregulaceae archaeon]
MERTDKEASLRENIAKRGSMLVGFSGGVDSGLLAVLAHDLLGPRSRCVLLDSPVVPRAAIREAQEIAEELGLSLEIIPAPHMESDMFRKNPVDRCYHCKKISARILKKRAGELGIAWVADGTHTSDTTVHRPGIHASDEEGILHPFIEAGITKEDIRAIARRRGLRFWDKPSAACLSSRIPYGEEITTGTLAMIESAEDGLRKRGVRQLRVRSHAGIARIEADEEGMAIIFAHKNEVVSALRSIGFSYVTLDLAGYRTGSMDEPLNAVRSDHDQEQESR